MATKLQRRIVARSHKAWGGAKEPEEHEAMAGPSQNMVKPVLEEMLNSLDDDEALKAAYGKLQKIMDKFAR